MTDVMIRSFRPAEWPLYRALRLRALRDSPDAFTTTYAEAAGRSDADWRDRLAQMSSRHDLALVAEVRGHAAGIVWVRVEPAAPEMAHLYQMWVDPACRGHGVGKALLSAAIDGARAHGARVIELGVTVGNSPARRLYEAAGFVAVRTPQPLRPGSELAVQDMAITLGAD